MSSLENALVELQKFSTMHASRKASRPDFPWYPYESFSNLRTFTRFSGAGSEIFDHIGPGNSVADVGAADGDTAFFFEHLGAKVTVIDNPQTNFNDCRGLFEMRAMLESKLRIEITDLDWTATIQGNFDIVMFLGILYHLRNPMLPLMALAQCSQRLVVNTAVFFKLDNGTDVSDQQLGYFLESREVNNDPTNYWFFTPPGLRMLLKRSGWIVKDDFCVGDVGTRSPTGGDARMYCYCERVSNWRDLRVHHDF